MAIEQYERQAVTNQGKAPSNFGYQAMASAQNRYFQGLQDLVGGAMSVADYYAKSIEERRERETEVGLSEFFRRRIIQMSSVQGADADNLLINEQAMLEKEKESVREQYKVNNDTFDKYWTKHTESYYDKVGNHQIQQGKEADENSRNMLVLSAKQELNSAPVGDLRPLETFAKTTYETFKHDLPKAYAHVVKGIEDTIGIWAKQNPQALLEWWDREGDGVVEMYGDAYLKSLSTVESARTKQEKEQEDQLVSTLVGKALSGDYGDKVPSQIIRDSNISAAVKIQLTSLVQQQTANAITAQNNAVKAAKEQEELDQVNRYSEATGKIMTGEMTTDLMNSIAVDPRYSAEQKRILFNMFTNTQKDSSPETAANAASLQAQVYSSTGMPSTQIRTLLGNALATGEITAAEARAIESSNTALVESVSAETSILFSSTINSLKSIYGPEGTMFKQADPKKTVQFNQMVQNLSTVIAGKSPTEVAVLLDLNNPNSYVNMLIRANTPLEANLVTKPTTTFGAIKTPPAVFGTPGKAPDLLIAPKPDTKVLPNNFLNWKNNR